MNEEEKLQRARQLVEQEIAESRGVSSWFYLSYADDNRFRGGCYLQGFGPASVALRASIEGISPGGEVRIFPIPRWAEYQIPADARNRLLTREELERFHPMKSMKDLEAEDE
jgi:hypothetical protein